MPNLCRISCHSVKISCIVSSQSLTFHSKSLAKTSQNPLPISGKSLVCFVQNPLPVQSKSLANSIKISYQFSQNPLLTLTESLTGHPKIPYQQGQESLATPAISLGEFTPAVNLFCLVAIALLAVIQQCTLGKYTSLHAATGLSSMAQHHYN